MQGRSHKKGGSAIAPPIKRGMLWQPFPGISLFILPTAFRLFHPMNPLIVFCCKVTENGIRMLAYS